MQFGLFQPVHKRRKNCKAKFLTIHITLIEAHGPRLILITAGPCAAGLEDVFSVNSGSYNYGHYHTCATQKCYVKCIHMALKYFFQSYLQESSTTAVTIYLIFRTRNICNIKIWEWMSLNNCVSTLSNEASEWQFVCVLILGPAEPKCLVWLVLQFLFLSFFFPLFFLSSIFYFFLVHRSVILGFGIVSCWSFVNSRGQWRCFRMSTVKFS